MSTSGLENKIVDRIVKGCLSRKHRVSPDMASFFARSIIINKQLGFHDLSHNSSEKIGDLVMLSIERLCETDSPRLETIKMQVSMKTASMNFEKDMIDKKKAQTFKSQRIADDIIKKSNPVEVFGDMVIFILHKIRMLDLSNETVEQETMKALESVIPRNFIHTFMRQDEEEKLKQLHELWKIVWGIKMFNNCSASSSEIEKERSKLKIFKGPEIKKMWSDTKSEISELQAKVNKLVEYLTVSDKEEINSRLRVELINRRQYLYFLNRHEDLLGNAFQSVDTTRKVFLSELENIQDMVTTFKKVEKSKIYPKFMKLSIHWKNSNKAFENVKRVQYLSHFLSAYKHSYNEQIDALQRVVFKNEEEEVQRRPGEEIGESFYEETSDALQPYRIRHDDEILEQKNVSCNHFDVVSITEGKRILKEASTDVDCCWYNNNIYGFESEPNLLKFFRDPQVILEKIERFIEIEPELIHLLEMENKSLPKTIISEEFQEFQEKKTCGTQCETHPIESYIDQKHEWSEWNLRKKALQIADLRNKRTHSTQTSKSHFRRDNNTQVFLKRETSTQTRVERGTNPRKHIRYVKNLRGKSGKNQVKVVNLVLED